MAQDKNGKQIATGDYLTNTVTGNLCKVVSDDEDGFDYTLTGNQFSPLYHSSVIGASNFERVQEGGTLCL